MKLHCIDISGSMSHGQLYRTQYEVLKRKAPEDIVAVFDTGFKVLTDIQTDIREQIKKLWEQKVIGLGGTDATGVLKFAEELKADTVLYSDGYLLTDQLEAFGEFVEIVW